MPAPIASLTSVPDYSWVALFLVDGPVHNEQGVIDVDKVAVITRTVVAWALLMDGTIVPVVATSEGTVVPADRADLELIGLAGPGEDVEKLARLIMGLRRARTAQAPSEFLS
jgi:hypothetical protein